MSVIQIRLDIPGSPITEAEPAFPLKPGQKVIFCDTPILVAALRNGTENGHPVVMLSFDTPDGTRMVAQATLRNFFTLAAALRGWNDSLPPDDMA